MKVIITEPIHEKGIIFLKENSIDVELLYETGRSLEDTINEADGIIVRIHKVTQQLLQVGKANQLKVVGKHGMGVDNIDVDSAKQMGIRVVYTPGVMANAVAEFTIGAFFLLTKSYMKYDRKVRKGRWMIRYSASNLELKGKTLGLIGYGYIGRTVANLAKSLGLNILVYDPYIILDEKGLRQVDLNTLLKASDFISIHVPLTKETYRMIGKKELTLIKKDAYIVNTARGGIIDEVELCEAVKAGTIAGALLDTTEEEPVTLQNPILQCQNIILTAHTAGVSDAARLKMSHLVCKQVFQVLSGQEPDHELM